MNILIIGAGSRGNAYAQGISILRRPGWSIRAIAEPDAGKRNSFGRKFIWGNEVEAGYGQSFVGWEDFIEWEQNRRRHSQDASSSYQPIDTVFICCLDSAHHPAITALAPLGLHILCEKPLCTSLTHSLDIATTLADCNAKDPKAFSIGHVLRYSPFNMQLKRLLCEELVIGEVISLEHTEPIGWWHFPHSYVRGNWRHEFNDPDGQGGKVGTLLTKSCHDIDLIMWLLASPSTHTGITTHEPASITSAGSLHHFRKARKPKTAGSATNCMTCPLQDEGCLFSVKRQYSARLNTGALGWPINVVVPDIEDVVRNDGIDAAQQRLEAVLAQDYAAVDATSPPVRERNWFGRCVYESDNDVVDNQTVVITWAEDPLERDVLGQGKPDLDPLFGRGPKTAVFHMTYPTHAVCERRGKIYGTLGEITYDSHSITVSPFNGKSITHRPKGEDIIVGEGHGGGDLGLASNFLKAAAAIKGNLLDPDEAQSRFIGCDVDEIVRSHAVVFAAEYARQTQTVVRWKKWWAEKHQTLPEQHVNLS